MNQNLELFILLAHILVIGTETILDIAKSNLICPKLYSTNSVKLFAVAWDFFTNCFPWAVDLTSLKLWNLDFEATWSCPRIISKKKKV